MRTTWTDKNHEEDVLIEINLHRELITSIRSRQSIFFQYIMKRVKLENTMTTGKLEDKMAGEDLREMVLVSLAS